MKKLSEITNILKPDNMLYFKDVPVCGISCTAEAMKSGYLFCCIDEFLKYSQWTEGKSQLSFVKDEAALLLDKEIPEKLTPQIIVKNALKSTAVAAKYFYDAPDEQLKIIGVTGTNGKTTITHFISHLLTHAGMKSCCMGTIGIFIDGKKCADSIYTTPLAVDLFKTFSGFVSEHVEALAMEISSHALKLDRVCGIGLNAAVFSNITRDHLDFHGTMEDYVSSKEKIFKMVKPEGAAVINIDDPYGKKFAEQAECRLIRYGITRDADIIAKDIRYVPGMTHMIIEFKGVSMPVKTRLTGSFNVYNTLAACGTALSMGIDLPALKEPLASFQSVDGRMETVLLPGNRLGIIDYAHTPDALENVLRTIGETASGRVITVFGCGGDRDRGKRPIMGSIAAQFSDVCIVTSDNPRTEDPIAIIKDIMEGIERKDAIIEPDRRKAIYKAFEISMENDIILVAGKGHETYQIIGTQRLPFSDKKELLCLTAPCV